MVTVACSEKRAFFRATRNDLSPVGSVRWQKRAATSRLVFVQISPVPLLFRGRLHAGATVVLQEKLKKAAFLFANSKKSS
jgi:hypothetical protein